MDKEVTVAYTEQIIGTSVRMQWYKLIGRSGLALFAFLAMWVVYLSFAGERSWIFGFILAVFVIYAGVLVFGYFRLRNLSTSKFKKIASPLAIFSFSDIGVSIEADTGKLELAWKMIDEVIESPDVWVLLAGAGSITLPTQSIDDELKESILNKVKKGGPKFEQK